MSYASAAAKGPKQSPEEARAPPPIELEHTDAPETSSLIDVDSESVHTVPSDFGSQSIKTTTQAERIEREAELRELARQQKEEEERKKKAEKQSKAKKAFKSFEENSSNPVYVGNALAVTALGAGLGFGAYRKYAAGELTWKVVAAWSGVVGLFATGDYFLSKYFFKRYPPKN